MQGREQNQGASAGRRLTSRSAGAGFFDVREIVPILGLPVGFAATGGYVHLACVGADAFERVGMNRGRFCRMAEDGGQPGATRKGAMPDEVERCRQVELAQAVAVGQAAGRDDLAAFQNVQFGERCRQVVAGFLPLVRLLRRLSHLGVGRRAEEFTETGKGRRGAAAREGQPQGAEGTAAGKDAGSQAVERGGEGDLPQGAAVGKCLYAHVGHPFGQADGRQGRATGEGVIADVGCRRRKVERRERRAAGEAITLQPRQAGRQFHLGQVLAVGKGLAAYFGDAVGQAHLLQALAGAEGALADVAQGGGEHRLAQAGAMGKGVVAQAADAFGQPHCGKRLAVGEGLHPDGGEAGRQAHLGQGRAVGEGLEADVGDAVVNVGFPDDSQVFLPRDFLAAPEVVEASGATDAQFARGGVQCPAGLFPANSVAGFAVAFFLFPCGEYPRNDVFDMFYLFLLS